MPPKQFYPKRPLSKRNIFCAHVGVRIQPARHTEQTPPRCCSASAPATPAEVLAAAACSPPSSSNANSLCCAVLAKSSEAPAAIHMDFVPDGFRSSNPKCPARQDSLCAPFSMHSCPAPAEGCFVRTGGQNALKCYAANFGKPRSDLGVGDRGVNFLN